MKWKEITDSGVLNEEQAKKFVEYCDKHAGQLTENVRVRCLKCGVSWPYEAPELCCCCAPNEVSDVITQVSMYQV